MRSIGGKNFEIYFKSDSKIQKSPKHTHHRKSIQKKPSFFYRCVGKDEKLVENLNLQSVTYYFAVYCFCAILICRK